MLKVSLEQNFIIGAPDAAKTELKPPKIIAQKKISRYLGRQVHFEQDQQVIDDLFMVVNNGMYWGMVEIRQVGAK